MDEKVILEAISSHIKDLSSLTSWLVPTSIIVFVSAFSKNQKLQILSVEVSRDAATIFVDTIVAFYSITALTITWRLYALFQQVPDKNVINAFTLIVTHNWILNPFAYFGVAWVPLSYFSTVLIVFFYVVCNDLGSLLRGNLGAERTILERVNFWIKLFNFFFGFIIAISMYFFYRLMSDKIQSVNPELSSNIIWTANGWIAVVLVTVIVTILFDFFILNLIQKHVK